MRSSSLVSLLALAGVVGCGGGSTQITGSDPKLVISVTPATANLYLGQMQQFTASARLSDGSPATGVVFRWSVNGGGTITSDGLFTPGFTAASVLDWTVKAVSGTASGSALARVAAGETPRARFSWADSVNVGTAAQPQWVPAGIRGDGRLRRGDPATGSPSNEYQGDFCGISALVARGRVSTKATRSMSTRYDSGRTRFPPAANRPDRIWFT
jgi:hypothetical protein